MAKNKIFTITVPLFEKEMRIAHYTRMGFTLLDATDYIVKNEYGNVVRECADLIMERSSGLKNLEQLDSYYKQYKKMNSKLDELYEQKKGDYVSGKVVLLASIPFGVLGFILGFGWFDTGWFDDLWLIIMLALVMGIGIGAVCGAIVAFIYSGIKREQWQVEAIKSIPILEQEIEDLTLKAQQLL